jgi:hypothetical protein
MPCPCCNTCGFCAFSSTISLTITDDYSGLANEYPIAPQSLGTFVLTQNTSEGSCPPYWEYSDWFVENRVALKNGSYVSLPFMFGIYVRFGFNGLGQISAQLAYQIEPVWLDDPNFMVSAAPVETTFLGNQIYGIQEIYAFALDPLFALYYQDCDPGDVVGSGPSGGSVACAGCASSMQHPAVTSLNGAGTYQNAYTSATILWEFS